jgi:hypothetical protein
MDLLIHDLAAACERDAAEDYDHRSRPLLHHPERTRREPHLRLRSGRVERDADAATPTAVRQPLPGVTR